MPILKLGSKGKTVSELQEYLNIPATGEYDRMTEAAVKNWQAKNSKHPSGVIDYEASEEIFDSEISTDFSEGKLHLGDGVYINRYWLPKTEYVKGPVNKKSIFIHHTAGWHNPYNQVDQWARDDRGRIGTHYIIGGPNPTNGDATHDGEILQCFPDEDWAYHLGVAKYNRQLDKESIGIELCNFGQLTLKDGKFYTWAGQKVTNLQVTETVEFRGYKYWHKYSHAQLVSLKKLLIHLAKKHGIDIMVGIPTWAANLGAIKAFEYRQELIDGKINGLFTHTNVRKGGKYDCSPQDSLIRMIKSL